MSSHSEDSHSRRNSPLAPSTSSAEPTFTTQVWRRRKYRSSPLLLFRPLGGLAHRFGLGLGLPGRHLCGLGLAALVLSRFCDLPSFLAAFALAFAMGVIALAAPVRRRPRPLARPSLPWARQAH
jgi:hypothetical protein